MGWILPHSGGSIWTQNTTRMHTCEQCGAQWMSQGPASIPPSPFCCQLRYAEWLESKRQHEAELQATQELLTEE